MADPYYIVVGDPNCSRVFYRISGSGAACADLAGVAQDMPRGDLLSAGEMATLSQWITELGQDDSDDDSDDDDVESAPTASERTAAAVAVIALRCAGCHNVDQTAVVGRTGSTVPAFSAFDENGEFVGADLVSPGNAEESWIFQALKTYGDYNIMPKAESAIPESEAEILRTWIEQIGNP